MRHNQETWSISRENCLVRESFTAKVFLGEAFTDKQNINTTFTYGFKIDNV